MVTEAFAHVYDDARSTKTESQPPPLQGLEERSERLDTRNDFLKLDYSPNSELRFRKEPF